MEALTFMFNSIVMVLLVFQGLRDDRRATGVPKTGLFRTRDLDPSGVTQMNSDQSKDLGF